MTGARAAAGDGGGFVPPATMGGLCYRRRQGVCPAADDGWFVGVEGGGESSLMTRPTSATSTVSEASVTRATGEVGERRAIVEAKEHLPTSATSTARVMGRRGRR